YAPSISAILVSLFRHLPPSALYTLSLHDALPISGSRPFRSRHLASLAREHRSVSPPLEDVPPPLQSLIRRGMAKRPADRPASTEDRKSTRLNSSHVKISYAVFCLKKKIQHTTSAL